MKWSVFESYDKKIISLVSNERNSNGWYDLIQLENKKKFKIINDFSISPEQINKIIICEIEAFDIEELIQKIPPEVWL